MIRATPGPRRLLESAPLLAGILLVYLAAIAGAHAQSDPLAVRHYAVTPHVDAPAELRVDFSILPGDQDEIVLPPDIVAVRANIGDVSIGEAAPQPYPAQGQTTAVLFLMDVSNPARQNVVERNLEQIAAMARAAGPHHRFALATFAESLEVVAEMGAGVETLAEAAGTIRATGQRTELIRLGAEAVEYLSAVDADRKVIFLFSDGEAEDDTTVYPPSHFADAARRADVRVYALGFHPSREATFGKMRFIAEQSGGALIRADRSYRLPAEFMEAPFAWPDAGGRAMFDLAPALEARLRRSRTLTLSFEQGDGTTESTQVDVALPQSGEASPEAPLGQRLRANWPLAAAGVAAVLAGLVLGVWLIACARRGRSADPEPVAFLEFLDSNGTRWPMRTRSIKIGRNADNDLQLKNDTVSAYHATVHLQRDGTFIVTDLNSLNGVVVDGEAVEIAELPDGAELELGEVRFRFAVTGAPAEGLLTGNEADRTLPEHTE